MHIRGGSGCGGNDGDGGRSGDGSDGAAGGGSGSDGSGDGGEGIPDRDSKTSKDTVVGKPTANARGVRRELGDTELAVRSWRTHNPNLKYLDSI